LIVNVWLSTRWRAASLIAIAFLGATPLFSQEGADYFYQRRRDGSEAIFNPLVWMINSGYFTLQIDNRTNRVFKIQYATGGKNVLKNLRNPIAAINKYGWKNFAGTELVPASLKKEKAQWVPNYFGHLLGGGMAFRKNQAWYRAHGYEHSTLCALLTHAASGLLNETVENNGYRGANVDPIADLLIFEPLGILLFGFKNVEDYCGTNFDMAYWPLQPVFDPFSGALENAGHGFVFKYKPPFSARLRVFYHFGIQGMSGLSYQTASGKSFSFALGVAAKYLQPVDAEIEARTLTATFARVAGFFCDKQNSLLFSCIISPETRHKVRFNVYPGVIGFGKISPGLFLALREHRQISLGLHLGIIPLGLGTHAPL
jgi:hypothetical protein